MLTLKERVQIALILAGVFSAGALTAYTHAALKIHNYENPFSFILEMKR